MFRGGGAPRGNFVPRSLQPQPGGPGGFQGASGASDRLKQLGWNLNQPKPKEPKPDAAAGSKPAAVAAPAAAEDSPVAEASDPKADPAAEGSGEPASSVPPGLGLEKLSVE